MLPDPLHPAIVHFPLVLAVLLPLFTAAEGAQTRLGRAREICRVVLALGDGGAALARFELVTPVSEADQC